MITLADSVLAQLISLQRQALIVRNSLYLAVDVADDDRERALAAVDYLKTARAAIADAIEAVSQ